jgi:hypothetical protein
MSSTYHDLVYTRACEEVIRAYALTHCPDCKEPPVNRVGHTFHPTRGSLIVQGCQGTPVLDPSLLGIECPQWSAWHAAQAAEAVRDYFNSWYAEPTEVITHYARCLLDGTVFAQERDVVRIVAAIADEDPENGEWWVSCTQTLHGLADGDMAWVDSETEEQQYESYGEGGPGRWHVYQSTLEGRLTLYQFARFCGGDLLRAATLIAGTPEQVASLAVPAYATLAPVLPQAQERLRVIGEIARCFASDRSEAPERRALHVGLIRRFGHARREARDQARVMALIRALATGELPPDAVESAILVQRP